MREKDSLVETDPVYLADKQMRPNQHFPLLAIGRARLNQRNVQLLQVAA